MKHNYINEEGNGDIHGVYHWSVSHNTCGSVLIQLTDKYEQVRLKLSPSEAKIIAQMLLENANIAEKQEKL